jgi:hypothetical protein
LGLGQGATVGHDDVDQFFIEVDVYLFNAVDLGDFAADTRGATGGSSHASDFQLVLSLRDGGGVAGRSTRIGSECRHGHCESADQYGDNSYSFQHVDLLGRLSRRGRSRN